MGEILSSVYVIKHTLLYFYNLGASNYAIAALSTSNLWIKSYGRWTAWGEVSEKVL